MINFDFMQFNQTNLWFFIFSALGLIRERRVLPFLIVILGNLIHGSMPAALIAGLILWHRMDLPSPKWVQLKDALGLFFIFSAAVAPEPIQGFAICFGVFALSISFGLGSLGVIPPLLLMRQYVPSPPDLEVLMGISGLYWFGAEGLRLLKVQRESIVRTTLEVICSFGILYGLREVAVKWIDDPVLISIGAGLIVFMLIIASIVHWRKPRFWLFYRQAKAKISSSLTFGNRFISSGRPWGKEPVTLDFSEVQAGFDRLFLVAILTGVLLLIFFLVNRGSLT